MWVPPSCWLIRHAEAYALEDEICPMGRRLSKLRSSSLFTPGGRDGRERLKLMRGPVPSGGVGTSVYPGARRRRASPAVGHRTGTNEVREELTSAHNCLMKMAGSTGLEPATSGLTVQCANQAAPRARLGDGRRLHDALSDCNLRRHRSRMRHRVAEAFPSWSARHTRSARSGMSRWRTPRCLRASTTALTMAGVEPMVAASPIPLAPMGLNGVGVTVSSVVNMGRSPACGTA